MTMSITNNTQHQQQQQQQQQQHLQPQHLQPQQLQLFPNSTTDDHQLLQTDRSLTSTKVISIPDDYQLLQMEQRQQKQL